MLKQKKITIKKSEISLFIKSIYRFTSML